MPIVHAVVLGLVQGLSEFLPISSSGHLLLVPWLFGWDDFDDAGTEKAFDVALHIGTLVAAVFYFRRDLVRYIASGTRFALRRWRAGAGGRDAVDGPDSIGPDSIGPDSDGPDSDGKVAWLLLLSTIPAAAVGAVFEESIDDHLGTPTIIAVSLIVFGVLLGMSDRAVGRRDVEEFTVRDALIVGAAQALALNPGTSRSGITMTAGRAVGFSRDAAARVSFLMMIPVTAGAVLFKFVRIARNRIDADLRVPMVVGIVTSGISGWFAVWGLLRLVRTRTFSPFVLYRIAAGLAVLGIVAAGWR